MRFLCVCNLAGILGVSNSHTFQNCPCVPPYPSPSVFPFRTGKEKVMEVKGFFQIDNELDIALGS